ncbi:COP-coated vesicle membrane protein gp25L precursor [Trypanosoma cruzi marinkellei]|uniref:COP-coated vesicle membrane protein gp25L n=1 Tax=Trypanosoma cruzi marinkellei TaxID=85056 RepID=K2M6V5_TRYCR|nr:COP-coated vesicle membrane protein gp25L precursor [Trypanosoma cruzi marinkellei]
MFASVHTAAPPFFFVHCFWLLVSCCFLAPKKEVKRKRKENKRTGKQTIGQEEKETGEGMRHSVNIFFLSVAVTVWMCALRAHAFAFDLPANKHRCFIEEVPSNTELRISFAALPGYAQFVDVVVTGPVDHVYYKATAQDRGNFHEFVAEGGDFMVCFYSRLAQGVRQTEGMKRSISVDIRVGSENNDYSELATKEKLRPIEVELRVLEDAVRSIHSEYLYYKEKEAEMRNANEAMTFKVTWFTAFIIFIFVVFSVWELRHLKSYFRKKRLID